MECSPRIEFRFASPRDLAAQVDEVTDEQLARRDGEGLLDRPQEPRKMILGPFAIPKYRLRSAPSLRPILT